MRRSITFMTASTILTFFSLACVFTATVIAQPQNPSPMVEHTREHPRLAEEHPKGRQEKLVEGTLFIPVLLKGQSAAPLLVFLHGGAWLPEVIATQRGMAVLTLQRSTPYADMFAHSSTFATMIKTASTAAGLSWSNVTLAGWSAGCGGIREILRAPESVAVVDEVLLIDGVHTSYIHDKTGPLESEIATDKLSPFLAFAKLAVADKKRLLVTHSEIFPGTFASTTETADWLLQELNVPRRAILEWGPMKTQMLSEAASGSFRLIGFAGNAAPDHVDQLHALRELLDWLQHSKRQ